MANGRLAKDVQYLCRHVEAQTQGQASVFEVDDNLEFLILHIMPTEGFYRGARIRFKVIFDGPYPDCTPVVNCCDKIYHPNIDSTEEDLTCTNICVSLLSDWTTSMDLDHVVMSILFLMYHPAFDDALSPLFDGCDIDEGNGEMEEDIRRSLRGEEVEGWTFDRLMIGDDDNDDANDDDNENAANNAANAVDNPGAENAVENVADTTGAENGGDNAGAEKAGDEIAATNEHAGNAADRAGAENAADNTGAENVADIAGAENAADGAGVENATDNTGVSADKDAVNEAIKDNPETESNTESTVTANTTTQSSTNTADAAVVAEIVSQENAFAVALDPTSETPCSADCASGLSNPNEYNEDGAWVAHSRDSHSSVSDSVASGIDGGTATFVPDMTCTDTETRTETVINANPDTALETSPQTAISDLTSCNFLTSQITNIVVINALNSADMVRPCQLDDFCIAGLFAQSKRAGPKDRMNAFSDLWQNQTVAMQTDASFRVGSPVDVTEVD